MDSCAGGPARRSHSPPSLEGAWAELNQLLLEDPPLEDFLGRLAELAASLVPGSRCLATVRREAADLIAGATTRSDNGGIPGQRRPRSETPDSPPTTGLAPVPDERGARPDPGLSIALVASGVDIGSLSLVPGSARPFTRAEIERLRTFARLAAPAVLLVLRQSAHLVVDDQLQEAVVTRAVIDQALGVLMHARRIGSREAFEELRQASQTTNRKVSDIAAEVIESLTGHPVEPPRPVAPPRAPRRREPDAS